MGEFFTQSARVDGSTGGSLQPFTYMYTRDSLQPSTVKAFKKYLLQQNNNKSSTHNQIGK